MSKAVAVLGGLFGAAALAWGGSTFYASSTFDEQIAQSLLTHNEDRQLALKQIQAEHGVMQSKGILGWKYVLGCDTTSKSVSGQIKYIVKHTPSLSGVTSVQSTVSIDGEFGRQLREMGNTNELFEVTSTRGYSGNWNVAFATPKISYDTESLSLRVSASKGTYQGVENAGVMNWSFGQVNGSVDQNQGRFSLKNIRLDFDLQDVVMGIGTGKYQIENIDMGGKKGEGTISNLVMTQAATVNGDVIDSGLDLSIRSVKLPQAPEVRNIAMKTSFSGLDRQAYESLSTLQAGSGCKDFTSGFASEADLMMIERAIADMLDRGWVMGIDELKAQVDDGSLDGQLEVAFAGAQGAGDQTLASRLSIDANVTALGAIVPSGFDQMLLGTGFVRETPNGDGLTGSVQLRNGEVRINGETDEDLGAQVDFFFNIGDSSMQQWRAALDNGDSMLAGVLGQNNL